MDSVDFYINSKIKSFGQTARKTGAKISSYVKRHESIVAVPLGIGWCAANIVGSAYAYDIGYALAGPIGAFFGPTALLGSQGVVLHYSMKV